jgi:pilus assembly protein FimV
MSRGLYPLSLTLAISLPGMAGALGLGDIHVDSALNEPLSAEIQIVGATDDELANLRAGVANRETFQHYGADRPAFLSSAAFKVTRDSQGRPVLAVRSSDAFTDPLVSLLVDLRWDHGELIREYSLLLDPAGLAESRRASSVAVADASSAPTSLTAPTPLTATASLATPESPAAPAASVTQRIEPRTPPVARADETIAPHRIAARDTLRAIVRRAGARSESSAQRMMIAIFHANPSAFDGNINRLHKGAMLNMPGAAALAAINIVDARREVQSQMAAWRGAAQLAGRSHPFTAAAVAGAQLTPELPQSAAPVNEPDREPPVQLDQRVQTLEQSLHDLQGQLAAEHSKLLGIQRLANMAATASAQPAAAAPAPAPDAVRSRMVPIAAGLGILVAGFVVGRLRRAGHGVQPKFPQPVNDKTAPAKSVSQAKTEGSAVIPASSVSPAESVSQVTAETATLARALSDSQAQAISDAHAQALVEAQAQAIIDAEAQAISDAHAQTITDALAQAISDAYALEDSEATQIAAAVAKAPAEAEAPTVEIDARRVAQKPSLETAVRKPTEPSTARLPRPPVFGDTTVNMALDTVVLGTNMIEQETTAQHVQMPSVMNEHVVIAERRTNIVQVLKMAIERDPHRRDLRTKLLEVYYQAASSNRLGFLEIARKLSRERDLLSAGEWEKIAALGREIAGDDPLFAEQSSSKPLADCA